MKVLSFLTAVLLPVATLCAKKGPVERFDKFHLKALSSSPIKLDDAAYEDLTTTPRDYSVVVLLTAIEARFGCNLCREFQSEWDIIGKSWTRGDRQGASRVLFGTLDFADGKATFQKVLSPVICPCLELIRSPVDATNSPCRALVSTYYWSRGQS